VKFAFCVEDETDEDVYSVILEKILGTEIDRDATTYQFARGGWSQALRLAFRVARRAAYSGLDGALFAIDNDGHPQHTAEHERADVLAKAQICRFCEIKRAANVAGLLGVARPGLRPLRFFFAVPVQVIETWLLLVRGHPFAGRPEAIGGDPASRRQLKTWLYGNPTPARGEMRAVALPLAKRLDQQVLAGKSPSFACFLSQC
jgi:hypothetical protein